MPQDSNHPARTPEIGTASERMERAERVRRLKEEVRSGHYQIDAKAIAESLIDEAASELRGDDV